MPRLTPEQMEEFNNGGEETTMKNEFISRINNRIKQKEGIIQEYEESIRKTRRHKKINPKIDIKRSESILNEEIIKLERVISELYNVINIYKKVKGGFK